MCGHDDRLLLCLKNSEYSYFNHKNRTASNIPAAPWMLMIRPLRGDTFRGRTLKRRRCPMTRDKRRVTVDIPAELDQKLEQMAARRNKLENRAEPVTKTELVQEALDTYVEDYIAKFEDPQGEDLKS